MIYRRWSLLTSTMVGTAGIIGAVVVANLFIEDPFLKPDRKKQDTPPSK